MSKIEELKQLMSIDACNTVPDIQQHFDHIAKLLFECFVIEYEGSRYLFKDIEFYYYNKNHRDIITHPRVSKAMQWYINDFGGIDLNFESSIKFNIIINDKKKYSKRYLLDNNASFGGILLRKLEKEDGSEILDGPLACAELFRSINAVSVDNDFPRLIQHDNGNVAYVCEKSEERRAFVKQHYPDVLLTTPDECPDFVIKNSDHGGADRVIEVAGGKDTFQLAWQCARPNSIVTVVALYNEPQVLPLPQMYGKNLSFKTGGVDGCDCEEILQLIKKGKIDTTPLITHRYPLARIEEAYELFEQKRDGVIKVAITQ